MVCQAQSTLTTPHPACEVLGIPQVYITGFVSIVNLTLINVLQSVDIKSLFGHRDSFDYTSLPGIPTVF